MDLRGPRRSRPSRRSARRRRPGSGRAEANRSGAPERAAGAEPIAWKRRAVSDMAASPRPKSVRQSARGARVVVADPGPQLVLMSTSEALRLPHQSHLYQLRQPVSRLWKGQRPVSAVPVRPRFRGNVPEQRCAPELARQRRVAYADEVAMSRPVTRLSDGRVHDGESLGPLEAPEIGLDVSALGHVRIHSRVGLQFGEIEVTTETPIQLITGEEVRTVDPLSQRTWGRSWRSSPGRSSLRPSSRTSPSGSCWRAA